MDKSIVYFSKEISSESLIKVFESLNISLEGKVAVKLHSGGKFSDQNTVWKNTAKQNDFLTAMAEAASSVAKLFKNKIAYINVMCNMSVDCDCCSVAEDPCMKDIGILASLDPIALDQACIDLVYNSTDKGKDHLIQRIESRNGLHTIAVAKTLDFGTTDYELVKID